jgi:hypothetical protein
MSSSATARMSGRLPDGDKNGLADVVPKMIDDPSAVHLAVVTIGVTKLVTDVQDEATLPTIRLLSIEPVPEGGDAEMVRRLIRRRFEARTGKAELPLEMELALEGIGVDGEEPDRQPDAAERAAGEGRDDDGDDRPDDDPPGGPLFSDGGDPQG